MNIDYSLVKPDLDNYLSVLLGLSNKSSDYVVSYDRAMELTKGLEAIVIKLGNNPNMDGTRICPYTRFGQRLNKKTNGPAKPYLRMYDYKYNPKGAWHIVYVVDKPNNLVRFIKIYGMGYNTGKEIPNCGGKTYNFGSIVECLHWMLRLGCMNEDLIKSASKRWLQ